ncbi:MAG: amidohydrolase [Ornithinimicrobium sp.]
MNRASPPEPSTAYLTHLKAEVDASTRGASPVVSDFDGAPQEDHEQLTEAVESVRDDLAGIVHTLHGDPETAYQEVRSAAFLAEVLGGHGYDVTTGAHGVATALRVEVATPGFDPARHRTVAVLSEYDALPQIGHGCGHNVIAATGVGAFLALGSLMQQGAATGVEGRVVFLGTPAEEGHTGKEVMAAGGAFQGLDCAIMVHPFGYDTASHVFLGRRLLSVTFTGRSAHASAQPFQGRNALDAATLAYQGIGLLRQQMPPSDRVHAIVGDGGHRASVIPDRAQLDLYVRSAYPDTLKDLSQRVKRIMQGAALMTDTGVELTWDAYPPSLPVRTNQTLAARWAQSQAGRGRTALPAGVVPEVLAGSTDFGNVSVRMPGIHPMIAISDPDVALHTREFAAAAATERAEVAAIDGAIGLAITAWDYLADDDLASAVEAEFHAAGGVVDVATYFD